MPEIVVPLIWLMLCAALGLVPASIARAKGRSFGAWWIYGTLLWLIAVIHIACLPAQGRRSGARAMRRRILQTPKLRTCPDCAEQIQSKARVCRFCGWRASA